MEKLKINVDRRIDQATVLDQAENAGWSDDPGTGVAVMALDERGARAYEVLNPMPFAPPIGWEPTPPIEELVRQRVISELARLKDEDEIDNITDAEDFDVPDELPPLETIYEVVAMESESPALRDSRKVDPKAAALEKVKADLDYEELMTRERLMRKRHRAAALKRQQEEIEDLDSPERSLDRGAPGAGESE